MFYNKSEDALNNLERVQGCAVFNLGFIANEGQRPGEGALYNDGDLVYIGSIPRDAVCIDIRILVHEAFPADTTLDYGFASYTGSEITDVVPIATGIVVETTDRQVVLPMPTSGNVNPDGLAYTGDRGGIWAGSGDIEMVVKINSSGVLLKGRLSILNSYSYFGTKAGGYIK